MDFVPPFLKRDGVHIWLIPVTLEKKGGRAIPLFLRVSDTLSEPFQKMDRGQENREVSLEVFHTLINLSH